MEDRVEESVYEEVLQPHLNLKGTPVSRYPAFFHLESNPSYRVPAHVNAAILASSSQASSSRDVKKSRSCFYIIYSIGVVIFGVLDSVSMAMALWSIALVSPFLTPYNIIMLAPPSSSCRKRFNLCMPFSGNSN